MKTTNAFIACQCDQAGEIVEFCAAQPVQPAHAQAKPINADSRDAGKDLLELAIAQQKYIHALPSNIVASLPTMPGFDGDWAETVLRRYSEGRHAMTTENKDLPPLPRFKYGYLADEWGRNCSLALIPDSNGNVVRYTDAVAAIKAIKASATSAPEQPGRQSFGEQYPHNPDAKCKCEHWEACTDCHPTYIKATPQPAEGA